MFESDDYDQVLSQIDFQEALEPEKYVETSDKFQINTSTVPSNVSKTDKVALLLTKEITENVFQSVNEIGDKVIELKNNNVNQTADISPKHTKRKIINSHFDHGNKRKFPGPAGLLTGTLEETRDNPICQIELLSQDIDSSQNHLQSLFETPLWKRLLEDTKNINNVNTIKIIKQQALAGNLRRRKAEIVRGFVVSIDRSAIDPLITLRDTTGHIKCTLHRDAWSNFASYIASEYCALVLQNPTVLTTGSAFKKHYLNITLSNIYYIYSTTIVSDSEELPDGFIKMPHEEFAIIKREKQIPGFNCSPNIQVDEMDELEGLDFSDMF